MKLYIPTIVKTADDAVQISKNNGHYITCVSAIKLQEALAQNGPQIVVEENGKRFGFDKEYVRNFLKESCIENIDWITTQAKFNALRSRL